MEKIYSIHICCSICGRALQKSVPMMDDDVREQWYYVSEVAAFNAEICSKGCVSSFDDITPDLYEVKLYDIYALSYVDIQEFLKTENKTTGTSSK